MNKNYTHVSFVLDNSGSMAHLRNDTIGGFNTFLEKQKEDPGKMTFSLYQFSGETNRNNVWGRGILNVVPVTTPSSPMPTGQANSFSIFTATSTAAGSAQPQSVSIGVATTTEGMISGPASVASSSVNVSSILNLSPTVIRPVTVMPTYEFVDLKEIPNLSTSNYFCDTNTPLLDAIGHAIDETGRRLAAMPEHERPEKVIFVILTDGEENASGTYNHEQITAKIKEQTDIYNWDFLFLGANQDAIQTGGSYGITRGRSMSLSATGASFSSGYNTVSETVTMMKSAMNTKNVNFDETIRAAVLDGTYKGK